MTAFTITNPAVGSLGWGPVLNNDLDLIVAAINARLPVVNVQDPQFGAVGDGVTNDAPAIQAAIDSIPAGAPGGLAYFPPGIYNTAAGTISYARDYITLMGAGPFLSLFKGPASSRLLDIGDGVTQYHYNNLYNLGFTRQTAGGAPTVRCRKQDQMRIQNCVIAAGTYNLELGNCVSLHLLSNNITSQTDRAISCDNGDQIYMAGNFFETGFAAGVGRHLYLGSGNKALSVVGNVFSTAEFAIYADGGASNDITISGNNVENCDFGFLLGPTASPSGRWAITGNTLRGTNTASSHGIRIYGADHAITGNKISNFPGASIIEVGASADWNLIVGNHVSHAITLVGANSVQGNNLQH